MKGNTGKWRLPLAVFAAAGLLYGAIGLAPAADAGVVGSPHDFSPSGPWTQASGVAPSGTCSACHVPHGAQAPYLWVRDLSGYSNPSGTGKLDIRNGVPSSEPNFLAPVTVACYDCHDYHNTQQFESPNTPDLSLFNSSHRPQDILFGFTKNSTGSMTEYNAGPQSGKKVPGYYETNPPGTSGEYGVNPSASLSQTGGHYFQQDPTGTSGDGLDAGGKLPCSDCHDPHAWNSSWQAFIRPFWPTGSQVPSRLSSTVQASTYMANAPTPTSPGRSNVNSRDICVACHGDSDTLLPVFFNEIRSSYRGDVRIARPPTLVGEHASGSQVACTSCHAHNSIVSSCSNCHSYPGQDNSSSAIKQMSRGHWPHVGKPGTGGTDNSMKYPCEVCHFNYGQRHNGSSDFTGNWWDNVDVQFNPALNPTFAGGGPTYNGQPAYGGSFARGAASGAANGVCAGLYCHGDNPDRNRVTWEGAAKQPKWDNTGGGGACGDCHGAGSNFRQGNHAVHLDNTGANARGPGGIAAFSPAGNCSDGTDTGCHTAYGLSPTTSHARGTVTFRTSPGNGNATDNVGTLTCNNCHSTIAVAFLDNGAANTSTGVALAKGNWKDNTYRLPCLTCHNNSGQTAGSTANAKMDGTGASWAPNIEKYWRASGHGYPSGAPVDNASTLTISGNVNQRLPIPCRYCHAVDSRHFGNTPATGNAWRLASWSGYDNTAGGLDKFCATYCHGTGSWLGTWIINTPDVPQDHFWNVAAGESSVTEDSDTHPTARDVYSPGGCFGSNCKVIPPSSTDKMPLGSDIYTGGGTNFLCVTCHDPHGTGPDPATNWGRSFAGANSTSPVDNVHMLRYEKGDVLCRKCHIR